MSTNVSNDERDPNAQTQETKSRSRKKRTIVTICLVVLILVAAGAYFSSSSERFARPDRSIPYDPDLWSTATQGGERNALPIAGVEYAFRYCPPTDADGFLMGSPSDEANRKSDEKQHAVVLTGGFWLLETETTQRLWRAVMGGNPSKYEGEDRPVERVSWDDANAFVEALNATVCAPEGWRFSLPTEAQWEYACRAGGSEHDWETALDEVAWHSGNSGLITPKTSEVGCKRANAWGLYDMLGNVWEWTLDAYGDYPDDTATDPCATSGEDRVFRGGSWYLKERYARPGNRSSRAPSYQNFGLGFRIALVRL